MRTSHDRLGATQFASSKRIAVRMLLALALGSTSLLAQVVPASATSITAVSTPFGVVPPDLPALNCNQQGALATQNTDTPAQILFFNQTLAPIQVDSLNTA